ncbi:C40 family peptidase [Clostridium sp.]|jgi:peptidoglycan DL-endopeptidase CwlO|uniref:C40 family peptidase n=1 Tax=Clostridium sp. TaxID=1506 RepID=UPI0039F61446
MKIKQRKILIKVLFLFVVTAVMYINTYEAKADTGVQETNSTSVRSAKIQSNRVIKVPQAKSEKERISRGSSSVSSSLVEYSYKFLGKPYVWASSGPNSFDCSGFTSYVYKKFGYSLPHYTGAQAEMGRSVSRKSLKAGDLVFFNTSGSNSHVGIYIGNGKFIHASSGRKRVMVSELNESYYESRYSKARRIIE